MKRHDSDDSQVAAKLQRFNLSGKALYKNQIINITIIIIIIIINNGKETSVVLEPCVWYQYAWGKKGKDIPYYIL